MALKRLQGVWSRAQSIALYQPVVPGTRDLVPVWTPALRPVLVAPQRPPGRPHSGLWDPLLPAAHLRGHPGRLPLTFFLGGGGGGRLQPCPKLAARSRACGCSHHLSKLGFRFPSRMARPRRPGAPESPRPWTRVRPGSTAGAGRCSSRSPAARTSRRSRNSSSSFVFRQPLRAAGYLFGGAGACARPRARAHQSARARARRVSPSPFLPKSALYLSTPRCTHAKQ